MVRPRRRVITALICLSVILAAAGCGPVGWARRQMQEVVAPTDVRIIKYHVEAHIRSIEEFTTRLYAKNPKYEPDPERRRRKLDQIFHNGPPVEGLYAAKPSHEVLTAAFAAEPACPDRVYLLGLGLVKSITEAYGLEHGSLLWSGLQVKLERLQRLHHNISQVNWRLKTYRDRQGELLFLTNEAGADGYINMGYEVIMTEILTRIKDDIYLCGGLPGKYFFDMSTLFATIVI